MIALSALTPRIDAQSRFVQTRPQPQAAGLRAPERFAERGSPGWDPEVPASTEAPIAWANRSPSRADVAVWEAARGATALPRASQPDAPPPAHARHRVGARARHRRGDRVPRLHRRAALPHARRRRPRRPRRHPDPPPRSPRRLLALAPHLRL